MNLWRRLRYLLNRKWEEELAEEIEFHRAMHSDPRALGNVTLAREEARAVWIYLGGQPPA